MLNPLRNHQTFSKVVATFYIYPKQCLRVLFSHLCRHLLLFIFLILAILIGVKEYFIMIFMCVSLMTDTEHLFTCLLAIYICLCTNVSSDPLPIFELSVMREWQPTPVFLPGESLRHRSLAGYSPWGHKDLDMTEATQHAHMSFYYCVRRVSYVFFIRYGLQIFCLFCAVSFHVFGSVI